MKTSEARKRDEASLVPNAQWSAVLIRDGEQVTAAVPCSDFLAAELLASLVAGWLGGPVSVVNAVVATRVPEVEPQGSLFGEVA